MPYKLHLACIIYSQHRGKTRDLAAFRIGRANEVDTIGENVLIARVLIGLLERVTQLRIRRNLLNVHGIN